MPKATVVISDQNKEIVIIKIYRNIDNSVTNRQSLCKYHYKM